MSTPLGLYITNECNIFVGTTLLFTLELNSVPAEGSFIEHTPLSGPTVKYRVQDVVFEVEEILSQTPGEPDVKGYKPRVRVEVVVVP